MVQKNIRIEGVNGKTILADVFLPEGDGPYPVALYVHGFVGFKDWGRFDLIADQFRHNGVALIKFNFSHNGTTGLTPEELCDLESFSENNYSMELEEIRTMVDWICRPGLYLHQWLNLENITLIGHSKGGAEAIIYASEDRRIKKLVTWAAVKHCQTPWAKWSKKEIADWQETGIAYYNNGRTGQQMPMKYQLREDFLHNAERLDVCQAISKLTIPVLICHGEDDTAVPVEDAKALHNCLPGSELWQIKTDHVFGRKHPWPGKDLPEATKLLVAKTLDFIKV